MDRNQPQVAAPAILGRRWLWSEDISVCAALSASSEYRKQATCPAVFSRPGCSCGLCRLSAYDTRSPALFQIDHQVVEEPSAYVKSVRGRVANDKGVLTQAWWSIIERYVV